MTITRTIEICGRRFLLAIELTSKEIDTIYDERQKEFDRANFDNVLDRRGIVSTEEKKDAAFELYRQRMTFDDSYWDIANYVIDELGLDEEE